MYMHSETGELRKTLEPGPLDAGGSVMGKAKGSAMDSAAESGEMDEEEKAKYVKIRHGAGI